MRIMGAELTGDPLRQCCLLACRYLLDAGMASRGTASLVVNIGSRRYQSSWAALSHVKKVGIIGGGWYRSNCAEFGASTMNLVRRSSVDMPALRTRVRVNPPPQNWLGRFGDIPADRTIATMLQELLACKLPARWPPMACSLKFSRRATMSAVSRRRVQGNGFVLQLVAGSPLGR